MPISNAETIVSLDINFSNGGGSHSASIKTVLKAKDLSNDEELGSLIGSSSKRTTFSNEKIQTLMNNFIEVEKTISQDGTKKSISRKYQDVTSLKLKSHCFLVRGRDCHPNDKGLTSGSRGSRDAMRTTTGGVQWNKSPSSNPSYQFSSSNSFGAGEYATIPYFSQLPNSPVTAADQKYPYRSPKLFGSSIIIGNIYNEESSVTTSGKKTSLTYLQQDLKEELSYNVEEVSDFYKKNPDLANYDLKYGYTLSEAKIGFAQAGISIFGLPESSTDKVLFDQSGTLDSVLSSIASKYGYYWYVDPFTMGSVYFVSSEASSQLSVINPLSQSGASQSKYLNASFSENFIKPKIVNAFSSSIEKNEQTFEFSQGERYSRFHQLDLKKFLKTFGISTSLFKSFYGLFVSGKFDAETFDAIAITAQSGTKGKIDWSKTNGTGEDDSWWKDSIPLSSIDSQDFNQIVPADNLRTMLADENDHPFNLKKGNYIEISTLAGTTIVRPSTLPIFSALQRMYSLLTNNIYFSDKFSNWKAKRMNWGSSPMSISGPFALEATGEESAVKIKDVDALQSFNALLVQRSEKDVSLDYAFNKTEAKGIGTHCFIGTVSRNERQVGNKNAKDFDYDLFNEQNYIIYTNPDNKKTYVGVSLKIKNSIVSLLSSSGKIANGVMDVKNKSNPHTLKAYYTRSKQPTNQEEGEGSRGEEEERSSTQSGLDAIQQRLDEIAERFDIRYYSLNNNGASGSPLSPVTLDIKNGSISDIWALEGSSFPSRMSKGPSLKSSSRTIVGLSLPNTFKVTISSISIQLAESGITTTIAESTQKLIPPNEQIIIDSNGMSLSSNRSSLLFSASQKNFLGL
jgi:hypothetical protein